MSVDLNQFRGDDAQVESDGEQPGLPRLRSCDLSDSLGQVAQADGQYSDSTGPSEDGQVGKTVTAQTACDVRQRQAQGWDGDAKGNRDDGAKGLDAMLEDCGFAGLACGLLLFGGLGLGR